MDTLPNGASTAETRKSVDMAKVTVSLDAELWNKFKLLCELAATPASTQLAEIIRAWIQNRNISPEEMRVLEALQRKVSSQINKEKRK